MAKRQRLHPDPIYTRADLKAAQAVFRDWCGDNLTAVEVFAAADLCKKIANAIAIARLGTSPAERPQEADKGALISHEREAT